MFKLPVRFLIAAPSMSGKSVFVLNLLKSHEQLMNGCVENIIWSCNNKAFIPNGLLEIPNVKVQEGLPSIDSIPVNTLLVIDDMQMSNLKDICTLFTVSSHHKNISIFFLVQNLFFSNPYMRTISLNSSHIVLFKSLRDVIQIQCLARQIFPDLVKSFMQVYKEVTDPPYAYLIIDLSQTCHSCFRLKTNIFSKTHFITYALNSDLENSCQIEKVNCFNEPMCYSI